MQPLIRTYKLSRSQEHYDLKAIYFWQKFVFKLLTVSSIVVNIFSASLLPAHPCNSTASNFLLLLETFHQHSLSFLQRSQNISSHVSLPNFVLPRDPPPVDVPNRTCCQPKKSESLCFVLFHICFSKHVVEGSGVQVLRKTIDL